MGRHKKSGSVGRLDGDKRTIHTEHEISPPKRAPQGLSQQERKYWRLWAPALITMGQLTSLNSAGLKEACIIAAALDDINKFIRENNQSLLQEKKFIDGSGQEHIEFKESAYSKMRRDYQAQLLRFLIRYNLTPDKMAGLYKPKEKKDFAEEMLS